MSRSQVTEISSPSNECLIRILSVQNYYTAGDECSSSTIVKLDTKAAMLQNHTLCQIISHKSHCDEHTIITGSELIGADSREDRRLLHD